MTLTRTIGTSGYDVRQLDVHDLQSMSIQDLDMVIYDCQAAAHALHADADGNLRDKTPDESLKFARLVSLRDAASAHMDFLVKDKMRRHPRSVQYASGGYETRDGEPPAARPGDLLGRDQSVAGWVERQSGQPGYGGRDSGYPVAPRRTFDQYIRALIAGAPGGQDAEERALSEGVLTAGGNLVPTPLASEVIDLARNQMRVMQAGAVTVPMTSRTLKVPRLTGEGTPGWHSENAAISAADMTFDAVTFTAQTLTRLVLLSVELFEDSEPAASDVIARSFARQVALELDRACLRGSGTAPEPRGVLNQTGVTLTAHGANGSVIGSPPAAGVMGWEFLAQAVGIVQQANFEPGAQIMNPRTNQSLSLLRDTQNRYLNPPAMLDGHDRLITKQVPVTLTVGTSADCSEVYTGQWDQLWLGIRTSFQLLPLRERFIDNGQYGFLAWIRADVQLAQPAAFNVDTGVRS